MSFTEGYWVMDGDHFDGPFELKEAIEFMFQFLENPSPEMFGIVLTKWENPPRSGVSLKLCKVNGVPLNVGFLKLENIEDLDIWLAVHEVKAA